METTTSNRTALFTPAVTLSADGKVEIDWASSWSNTYDHDTNTIHENEPEPRLSEVLDSILGGPEVSAADQLRRLADYMDGAGK